uniref:Uncharacterized protein n=1 Tax=Romanomermis culicivorax TaxID=13658 RepID=A0A915I5F5_ROMCU
MTTPPSNLDQCLTTWNSLYLGHEEPAHAPAYQIAQLSGFAHVQIDHLQPPSIRKQPGIATDPSRG